MLHDKLRQDLEQTYQQLKKAGEIIPLERLEDYYATFREKFGPERLASLDGEALLYLMKGLGEEHRDGLVYWLEFKNDEEFPTPKFGSIAGGSALKYGIYNRKEDGAWITGSSRELVEFTVSEAIAVARKHRDQLLRGVELLERLPATATQEDYRHLQQEMNEASPDIADSAWAHKYFHMLFPERLDDYHVRDYQDFHLIRLLQLPPEMKGRYVCAKQFVDVARGLNWHMSHLTTVLNRRNGRPYAYWRIGTTPGGINMWDMMKEADHVAIGWPALGDLTAIPSGSITDMKEAIRNALKEHYPNDPSVIGRKKNEIYDLAFRIEEGDLVLPSDGREVLGIGRVAGDYQFVPDSDAPHRLPVEWLSIESWPMPEPEGLRTTVYAIKKHEGNLVEIERRILEAPPIPPRRPRKEGGNKPVPMPSLQGIPGRIQSILNRKKQVILYGPPGTGKTYWAQQTARDLASYARLGKPFSELSAAEQQTLLPGNGNDAPPLRMCTFHPAYGYEDFIEGYRPETADGQLVFEQREGIFKRLCADARQWPSENFYLIIDEFNRGDIPRIFGELLTVLEEDKRGQTLLLPLSGEQFLVPDNVYLIATMNTADRSIALLDTALRRRFGFIELMPDSGMLAGAVIANSIPLGPWLEALNERILEHIGRDARNLQIGHAYLLDKGQPVADFKRFTQILRDDIIPLLQEYTYEDYPALANILGEDLVDVQRQRIRDELFAPERRDELIAALLAPAPDLAATADLVASEAASEELQAEEAQQSLADEEEEG